jgi:hypothetical protein
MWFVGRRSCVNYMESFSQCLPTWIPALFGFFGSVVGGSMALGGLLIVRKTELKKLRRQAQITVFAEFLGELSTTESQAINAIYSTITSPLERDTHITELYCRLSGFENKVRLHLPPEKREYFSKLREELWELYSPGLSQAKRIARSKEINAGIQQLFEVILDG